MTEDPGSKDEAAQQGNLRMRLVWDGRNHTASHTGQTPVLKYNRQLMQAILYDRLPIAKIVNATVMSLEEAPQGYQDFDKGAAKKYVLDPHGLLKKAAGSQQFQFVFIAREFAFPRSFTLRRQKIVDTVGNAFAREQIVLQPFDKPRSHDLFRLLGCGVARRTRTAKFCAPGKRVRLRVGKDRLRVPDRSSTAFPSGNRGGRNRAGFGFRERRQNVTRVRPFRRNCHRHFVLSNLACQQSPHIASGRGGNEYYRAIEKSGLSRQRGPSRADEPQQDGRNRVETT